MLDANAEGMLYLSLSAEVVKRMKLEDIWSMMLSHLVLGHGKAGIHVTLNGDALAEDLDQNGDSGYVICQAHVVGQSDRPKEDINGSFRRYQVGESVE